MRVTLIQGGGVGYDLVPAVRHILDKAGVRIDFDEHLAGGEAMAKGLDPLPRAMLDSIRQNGLALKTKLLPSPETPHVNYNVVLRRELGQFASVRPLKNLRGLPARFQNVDMLVVRELTEDLYAAIEHQIVPGVVQSIKVVTEAACRRFFRFAFDWAQVAGRKTIHCVHKANILKLADGLFLEAFRSVAKDYPQLQTKEIIVDNCCMQMVAKPQQFDVLVMGNLYGDIVSDLGAGVVGGISATAGINVGDGVKIFETFHGGSHAEIGADRANPLPLLLPALDLLEMTGQKETAARILRAVETVLTEGRVRTADLGGSATTRAMADAVVAAC
ncbi:MAG: isocitrate/isopropylmalate family dehydrogenase [Gemmataceae bacterium]|nr:isocitrate/isopropylmalate family dehydrogenase [Gemmataceae bacterium]